MRLNPKDGAEMVWIPEGEFFMGSDLTDGEPDETPMRRVYLDGYWITKNLVTVAQFRRFCEATKFKYDWKKNKPKWDWWDDHPMINVSWEEARVYAQWAGGDLPTEAQWEKAARGTDGRKYPWGEEWDANRCANKLTCPMPIGSYLWGASPFGILDMAGNAAQWCRDWYGNEYYKSGNDRNPPGPAHGIQRVLRGSAWSGFNPSYFRCANRFLQNPTYRFPFLGFRCVIRSTPL